MKAEVVHKMLPEEKKFITKFVLAFLFFVATLTSGALLVIKYLL